MSKRRNARQRLKALAAKPRVRHISLAWYTPDTYEQMREHSVDAEGLYDTFEDWLVAAEEAEQMFKGQGHVTYRVAFELDEWLRWCAKHGMEADGTARSAYAAWKGRQLYGDPTVEDHVSSVDDAASPEDAD